MSHKIYVQKLSVDTVRQLILVCMLIVLCIIWSCMTPSFLMFDNLINILRQTSYTAIASIGMTMVIIIAQIDISAGSLIAISGLLASWAFKATGSVFFAVLAARENCMDLLPRWQA